MYTKLYIKCLLNMGSSLEIVGLGYFRPDANLKKSRRHFSASASVACTMWFLMAAPANDRGEKQDYLVCITKHVLLGYSGHNSEGVKK